MMMQPFLSSAIIHEIGSIQVQFESDVVRARNLGSLIAQELKFDKTTCIKIGTAVSELSRNIIEHALTGKVDFSLVERKNNTSGILLIFKDSGQGIDKSEELKSVNPKSKKGMGIGLSGSQRLMDDFDIESIPQTGTTITTTKWLPRFSKNPDKKRIIAIQNAFQKTFEHGDLSMVDTINSQNRELQYLLKKIQERNDEIETINRELEETNQGVVALNRELEDRTVAIENAKQEAEKANVAKSEFLANMSHEIRTPMNAILGFTEILENKITDKNHLKFLSAISSSGKALLSIINDILDLSKIEAGKMELQNEAVNLFSLINEVKQIFHHKTKEKNINCIVDVDPTIPKVIFVDHVRLRQILFNLVGNAVKFTDKGYVKLSIKNQPAQNENQTIDLLFQVQDSGIGIPEEQINNIFKAFEQQKNQNLNKYGGTGLGLTITNRLIKMMGGDVQVQSEVGKGSTFTVHLKNLEVSSMMEINLNIKEKDISNVIFEPAKILVVDDIANNRELIISFLEHYNLEILDAENGEEAIKIARESVPDLVLMDLKMPVMDGYQATSILKADDKLKSIPIVALTASAMKEEKEKILASGFDHYLRKPISQKRLISELIKFLNYKRESFDNTDLNKSKITNQKIDKKFLNQLPELIRIMNGDLKLKWETIRSTFILSEITSFAQEIKNVGEKFNAIQLVDWSEKITEQAQSLDMEKLPTTLQQYEEIISSYNSIVKT